MEFKDRVFEVSHSLSRKEAELENAERRCLFAPPPPNAYRCSLSGLHCYTAAVCWVSTQRIPLLFVGLIQAKVPDAGERAQRNYALL